MGRPRHAWNCCEQPNLAAHACGPVENVSEWEGKKKKGNKNKKQSEAALDWTAATRPHCPCHSRKKRKRERFGSLLSALARRDRPSTDTTGKSQRNPPPCPRSHPRHVVLGGTQRRNFNRAIGILSLRNFDPETRTLRKHTAVANGHDHGQEDTLEKNVEGLAQAVLAADEARQAAELVCIIERWQKFFSLLFLGFWIFTVGGPED